MAKVSNIPKVVVLLILAVIFIQNVQAYPINVTDDYSTNVTINNSSRIVSLAPSNTEILFAVGAGSRVVGVTTYADYPPEVRNISKIGGPWSVNKENVVNLTPDLVLAFSGNGKKMVNELRNLNLTVVTLHPKNLDDIIKDILLVGNITDNDANASRITKNMRQDIKNITDVTNNLSENQKPRVLYIVSEDLYAAGNGTYADDLIKKAGGINIAESSGWPKMSLESVVAENPQIIITSGMGTYGGYIRNKILNNTVLASTDAVRANRVYAISDSNIVERSGPRITQGLQELYNDFRRYIITSWGNSRTNDKSTSIKINKLETTVRFNATANHNVTWNWYVNGVDQNNSFDNYSYNFASAGTYTVSVNASNVTSDAITWNINVKAPQTNDGSGSSGSSGVISSEPYKNIVKFERHDNDLVYNKPVDYMFSAPELGIDEVIVTGKENVFGVTIRIEDLKGISKSVTISPQGIVYKNLNILAGTRKIKEALIRFKVKNSWLDSNNLAAGNVRMVRWHDNKWTQLDTTQKTKGTKYTSYEAKTPGFSSFAIVGLKEGEVAATETPKVTQTVTATPAMSAPTSTQSTETPKPTPTTPGFESILAIVSILLAVHLRKL